MTRRITLAVGFGSALIACGGISREQRDGTAANTGGSAESGSAGNATAGSSSAGGSFPRDDGTNASGSSGAAPNEDNENHYLTVTGNVSGLAYDFSCTADTGEDRVRSVEGDVLRCNSRDAYDVTIVIAFPPIGEGFEPGPFDFEFTPSEPSPATIEIFIGSGVVNSTVGTNFEAGRLSGTLERIGDPPNAVDVYTGTFDGSWYVCGKGCDGGATKGTFRSEFAL